MGIYYIDKNGIWAIVQFGYNFIFCCDFKINKVKQSVFQSILYVCLFGKISSLFITPFEGAGRL